MEKFKDLKAAMQEVAAKTSKVLVYAEELLNPRTGSKGLRIIRMEGPRGQQLNFHDYIITVPEGYQFIGNRGIPTKNYVRKFVEVTLKQEQKPEEG